ncbi:hypothetical protein F8M41_019376 [Gigaspora margarita]|uniref:Uncharacterized protein n=1 Tax=Gigaspora margarita TaxID=4874 RepID=A0A8H4EW33_GIGMA|nr:hypothetical protein F8M41_019376 [Gigaspora margarita]
MYNIENPNKNDYLDLEDNDRFSYRKLSEIATSKILEFTKEQSNLITSENKLSWSVAVSDKLYSFKKSYKSTVRLLAISCISKHDMTPKDHIYPEGSKMPGFITIFSINEDYSIGEMLKLNEYGGIVKLFSKNGDNKKMNKNNQYIDNKEIDFKETKENKQNLDKFFLVILNVSGIHKYQFGQLNNKHAGNIQNLKYPKRIYNAIKFNSKLSARVNMKYILKCLNKHYFLVDAKTEGVQYMELYDLKTDQLGNTFKRQNLNSLNFIVDIPANFTISNNNKLLAYNSENQVKLYLIECGLEIASIEIKTDEMFFDGYFVHFFNDDERLLIYRSKNKWTIWDIFGSIQESIKLENQLELDLKINEEEKEKDFSDDKRIYDDLTSDYLKSKGDKKDFQTLSLEENFEDITDKKKWVIFDLDHKKNELDEYYYIFEPCYTIQVWYDRVIYDQSKKRTLQFISVIDKNESKSEVKKIEYAIRRFKLSFQSKDSQSVIGIGSNDDIIYAAKEACYTLKYLNQIYHSEYSLSLTVENCQIKFQEIVKQTRNIILRFIMLYPTAWRLLDFRFDLLSILIEAREYTIIKYILFNETDIYNYYGLDLSRSELVNLQFLHKPSLHMPQYFSWGGETINTIFKAFEDDDPIFLGFLLEYYSIKAVEDIGWMITVGEIIPMLYNKNNKNYEVFIPITQLIPQESILKVEEISPDKIPDIKMVPLIDYTTNNELSIEKRGNKYMNFLKSIFCPGEFVSSDEYRIPFLSLLYEVEHNFDDPFYYNPSMEAIMNFIWHSSKSH